MGYIVTDTKEITVNVDIKVPGESEISRISATWVLHDYDDFQKRNELIQKGSLTDERLVKEDLIKAGPFFDKNKKEIEFSEGLILDQMKKTFFRQALVVSWWDAQMCRNEYAEKN
jgi:hypothetical protein